ncbi:hypothetical protein Cadr_000003331 [Camelus dromedarius]|uniref:Uncharacterized protein n=1 Tax=Camelus dromedarius TaxID=9838 RepID=A0A5N4C372_CAMDR|nr:hypothetical protein Cadr_000003331 [Camelus dromedarius]
MYCHYRRGGRGGGGHVLNFPASAAAVLPVRALLKAAAVLLRQTLLKAAAVLPVRALPNAAAVLPVRVLRKAAAVLPVRALLNAAAAVLLHQALLSAAVFPGLGSISTPSPATLRRILLPEFEVLSSLSSEEPAEMGGTPPSSPPPVL